MYLKYTIFRDVKPANFVIALNNPEKIKIIDFDFSLKYLNNFGLEIQPQIKKSFAGTPAFCSLAQHRSVKFTF